VEAGASGAELTFGPKKEQKKNDAVPATLRLTFNVHNH
jgi:hypothetical protein